MLHRAGLFIDIASPFLISLFFKWILLFSFYLPIKFTARANIQSKLPFPSSVPFPWSLLSLFMSFLSHENKIPDRTIKQEKDIFIIKPFSYVGREGFFMCWPRRCEILFAENSLINYLWRFSRLKCLSKLTQFSWIAAWKEIKFLMMIKVKQNNCQ